MLRGWRQQQLSRNLAFSRVDGRERLLRAFQAAIRSYEHTIRTFCSYLTDGRYGWVDECERRFGTHPIQICFAWNTASHSSDFEGNPVRRALTKPELQRLFDLADDQVARARHAGRKGWLAAFRDATLFKVTYAWSLRRREVTMLDIHDFAPNPKAPEFHHVGVLRVRHGKATRGSPPKRRSVLTVMDWSVEVVEEWLGEVRPLLPHSDGSALWPSERALRIGLHEPNMPAPLLCHPPHRGRLRPAVRPAAGRPRIRLHPRPLHLGVVGLQDHHGAPRPRRRDRPGAWPPPWRWVMTRTVGYHWRLRQVMAEHDLWKTTDLVPLLAERGITLSAAQVYRLVAHPSERLSLRTLAALCDIFACTPNDLLEPYAGPTALRKVAGEAPGKAPRKLRPKRARIIDQP
jgi:DNA-binding Xre family transcriptional regulator